ncbi:MAG: hypothetical protein ACE5EN_11800 [Nitrospinota bacterium]
MKQSAVKAPLGILQKIESIEEDVMDLKLSVLKNIATTKGKVVSLKGILKGVDVSNKDISQARKALSNKVRV